MKDWSKIKKAKEKRIMRQLKRQRLMGLDPITPKLKSLGLVDDDDFGSKPPQMSLLEARAKLCL